MRNLIPQLSILILHSVLSTSTLYAADPVILSDEQGTYPLGLHLEILNDPGQQWTIQDVSSPPISNRFVPSPIQAARFTAPVGWVRFTITNKTTKTREWLLVDTGLGSPDRVDLFIPDVLAGLSQSWTVQTLGNHVPVSRRAVKYRHENYLLTLEPDTTRTFFLRHRFGRNARATDLVLYSFRDFFTRDHESQIAFGLFFGLVAVMAFYNLFLFLSLRDWAYLYYVLSMGFLGMGFANVDGIAQEYLWPDMTVDDSRVAFMFTGLYLIFQGRFMQTFLLTRTLIPRIHALLSMCIGVGLYFVIVALLDLPAALVPRTPKWIFLFGFVSLNVLVPLLSLRRGFRPARYFLIASSSLCAGTLLYALERLNILPSIALFQLSRYLGYALEAILFSLALADRIKILREEKETQEAASREAQLSARTAQAANQAKSRFLANMSHEIRTPMNAILGYAQILQRKTSLAPDDRQAVETIHRSGDHLLKLINDVLDISKIELAQDGKEALEKVTANPPDIVLLDIHMPEMNGPEAARRIWETLGRDALKIVAVSASTLEHEQQEFLELGFDDFVPKPFRTGQVYACLAKHLGVEFEYAQPETVEAEPALDLSAVSLPDELLQRLKAAAEVSSVTELEQILDEVGKQSPEAGRLAGRLRGLSQDFKMDEILNILKEI